MTEKDSTLNEEMAALRKSYAAHLEAELEQLELLAEQLSKDDANKDVLEELDGRLHQLAGSAGIYGYDELGGQARAIYTQVQNWLSDQETLTSHEVAAFTDCISGLKDLLEYSSDIATGLESLQSILEGGETSSGEPLKVLLVDDDKEYAELMTAVLKENFNVSLAFSGEDALVKYQEHMPDILLLDINLPDMSGYEVCAKINDLGITEWCSTIFVSANNSVEGRLAAFNVGGDDFIAKPFDISEFAGKIKALAAYTQSKKQLVEQNKFTQSMVFESMAESAQYGHLVDFLRRAMNCERLEELVDVFFDVCENYGLNTSLCFHGDVINCYSPHEQPCSPIETNLFEVMYKMGRLYHFDARTMVNDEHISFLVKNMPVDNEKEYGRLKDVVAVLAEAMESSYLSIHRKQLLTEAVVRVDMIQEQLRSMFLPDSGVTQSLQRMRTIMDDIQSSFHFMDLDERQEEMLYGLLEKGENDASVIQESIGEMRNEVARLAETLQF